MPDCLGVICRTGQTILAGKNDTMRIALLATLALLLGGSVAHADCASDFAGIMKHAREVGPHRIEDSVAVGSMRIDTLTQIVPPGSIYSKVTRPDGAQEVIVIGGRGWQNTKGMWLSLSVDAVKTVTDSLALSGPMYSDNARNVECLGRKNLDGVDYLAFRYNAEISNFTVPMTAYVDPATNLPVKGEGSVDGGGVPAHFTASYKLDPTVKIEPPPEP